MNDSQDFKYVLQDAARVYIGAKLTYGEMMDRDDMPFKLKAILSHYMLKEVARDTTPENHIFYMEENSLSFMVYRQLGVQFRMSVWNPGKSRYQAIQPTIGALYQDPGLLAKKDEILVEELIVPKLKIMVFTV